MAATMTAPDLYHGSALDDTVLTKNGQTNRRITEQEWRSPQDDHNMQRSTGVNAPVIPTISYRGVAPHADPSMHRSFSQRAKGRPFADEAFLDDQSEEHAVSRPRRVNGRAVSADNQNHSQAQPVSPVAASSAVQRLQHDTNTAAKVRSERMEESYGARASDPFSSPTPATLKDAGNQTDGHRRNWASDRSPLQKLEVKLTDISKEEKRARVQEAEMRLRESQGLTRNQKKVDKPSRSISQPMPLTSQPRNTSATSAPNRPGQSIVIGSGANEATIRQSQNGRQPRQGPVMDIPIRQHGPVGQRTSAAAPKQQNGVQKTLDAQQALRAEVARTPTASRAAVDASKVDNMQSQIPRSVSSSQKQPQRFVRANERPLSERERNASHQAALQQLTGQATADDRAAAGQTLSQSQVQRTSRIQRSLDNENESVPVDIGTLAGGPTSVDQPFNMNTQQAKSRSTSGQSSQPMVGLGVHSPPVARATSQSINDVNASKSRQRKSSVSFKEPFDTRRPVDEWKAAETARLTAEDFVMEKPQSGDAYKAWWEQGQSKKSKGSRTSNTLSNPPAQIDDRTAVFNPPLHLKCGPLLRYAGLKRGKTGSGAVASTTEYWRGTVMIVTQDSRCSYNEIPTLRLFSQPKKLLPPPPALVTGDQLAPEYIDPIAGLTKLSRSGRALYVRPVDHLEEAKDLSRLEDDNGIYEASPSPLDVSGSKDVTSAATNRRTLDTDGEQLGRYKEVRGTRIYADPDRDVTFWRFNIEIELGPQEQHVAYRINKSAAVGFWVPAQGQTMNIMFHSCNGFSVSVDSAAFSGPDPLWRDVLNNHQTRPFHVMLGGGDQVYNDRVMVDTQLFGEWTRIRNPHHKHQVPFSVEMKNELETFYLERYSMWFSQGLFGMANASIPMVNVWDDHDIIDGFGSYPDDFMRSPVFCGLGEIAHKYYLLFQHQSIDAMTEKDEPSWVLGTKPGPYIQHLSRSVYLELGQHVAFLGLDCRTERTRHDILSDDTLEIVLERCRREMIEGQTKHLIVLLGVPIAYPRLVWLENILTSKALDPIKALHRAGIMKTKLLNKFDGGVEILDDLDDHWTASHHKVERNILIQDLQDLAAEKSARITILSGDVHLAAIGRFYSNPKLRIPVDKDHRYMPNIISSAIVNTPPPDMLADVLNKRNKVHHLDKYTDENMIPMFTHDVDDKKRNNIHLLPRRNWCSIREYNPGDTPPPTPPMSPSISGDDASYDSEMEAQYSKQQSSAPKRQLSLKNDFNPRNLMRRFSSRGAPPNAYKQTGETGSIEPRAASLDGVDRTRVSNNNSIQARSSSADNIADVPALRPTFLRRPTNLAEKAARKGIIPAIDGEGNEVHINDHINLEGGLDIVLNCEVNQKDPAGITNQYRLLVPALWYDGSSDREKIDAGPQVARSNTFMQKLGLNRRKGNRSADNQGAGNWGQEMSESESWTESEEDVPQPAKKRFSLFGSKRNKQQQQFDSNRNGHEQNPPSAQVGPNSRDPAGQINLGSSTVYDHTNPYPSPNQLNNSQPREFSVQDQRSPLQSHVSAPQQGMGNTSDGRFTNSPLQETQHSQYPRLSAPQQPLSTHQSLTSTGGSLQGPRGSQPSQPLTSQQRYDDSETRRSTSQPLQGPRLSNHSQSRGLQAPQQRTQTSLPGISSQRNSQSSRPLSYIISGGNEPSVARADHSSIKADSRPPYDPDAAYVSNQYHNNTANLQRSTSLGTTSQPRISAPNSLTNEPRPPPTQLRGNGILGKNIPPTSFPNNNTSTQNDHQGEPRGYSGIEAYKDPKPRRRWSLRERAKNMMGGFDRRRNDEDEWYSDEEEEAYWEGGRK